MTAKVRIGTSALVAVLAAAPMLLRAAGQEAPTSAAAPASAANPAEAPSASPDQVIQADINRLSTILLSADSRTSPDQREQAAERLLSYRNFDGTRNADATRVALDASRASGPQNLDVRRAVARALLALPAAPDPAFLDPLRGLMSDAPQDAAAALARYAGTAQAPAARDTLIDFAANGRLTPFSRAPATSAVGAFGDRDAAQFLVAMLDDPAEDLRNAASDGLITLTGYAQNGQDVNRWKNWWQATAGRPNNEWAATVPQAARAYQQDRREDELTARVDGLLRESYQSAANDPRRQEAMEVAWLRDAQPAIRIGAASIASQQTLLNRQLGRDVIEQLRSMISDAAPEVRRLVVITLNNSGDTAATNRLIAQLTVEPDSEVKRQIALALGKFHQLSSVPWLLQLLLEDPNPRVVTAAADALKGDFAEVIRKNPATLQDVTQRIHNRLQAQQVDRSPAASDRLSGLLNVAASLGDQQLWREYENALLGPNQPVPVRIAGAHGLGAITGPDRDRAMQDLLAGMSDPDKSVAYEAIKELAKIGTLSAVRQTLVARVDPTGGERDRSIREAAWQALLDLAAKPDVSARAAIELADVAGHWAATTPEGKRLRSQRRTAMLEVAVPKLREAMNRPAANLPDLSVQLADLDQNVGDEYFALGAWDRARVNYSQALELRQQPGVPAPPVVIKTLAEKIEKSYLAGGKYQEAVNFAAQRAQAGDAEEKAFMGALIRDDVDRLIRAGKLTEANQLADLALKMQPPLDSDVATTLRNYQREINDRLSSQGKQGATPASGLDGPSAAGER